MIMPSRDILRRTTESVQFLSTPPPTSSSTFERPEPENLSDQPGESGQGVWEVFRELQPFSLSRSKRKTFGTSLGIFCSNGTVPIIGDCFCSSLLSWSPNPRSGGG